MTRRPHVGPMPAAMQRQLNALKTAVEALPADRTPVPAVADPIFGHTPPPPAPSTAHLPPALAGAFDRLQAALEGPAPEPTWPIVNTPRLQAQLDALAARGAGRPSAVQPNQVVRLVRFVKLGHSLRQAAEKAGLAVSTAHRILDGRHPMADHPAVTLAGVHIPQRLPPAVPKPFQKAGKAPTGADPTHAATPVATQAASAPKHGGRE